MQRPPSPQHEENFLQGFSFLYDRQIIVDFDDGNYALALKYKWDKQHPDNLCKIINDSNLLTCAIRLNRDATKNKPVRFCVIAHGATGSDVLQGLQIGD